MKTPRELADGELIEALVGRRRPQRVGELVDVALADIANHTVTQLRSRFRLPPGGARRLAIAAEIHRRLSTHTPPERPRMSTPEEAFSVMGPRLAADDRESLWCLPLDARSRLLDEPLLISVGDIDGTDAAPRPFFRAAVRAGATAAIACHPHPTGLPDPSPADRAVTKTLIECGNHLGLPLVDHLIVAGKGFCSLRRSCPELWGGRR